MNGRVAISIIVGVMTFILGFVGANALINWIVSDLQGSTRIIMKIVLWIVSFSTVGSISFYLGLFIGFLISKLGND